MKKLIVIATLIVTCHIGFGQVNSENIILEYDAQSGTEKIIFKSALSSDLDSLSSFLIEEKRKELLSTKDSTTIRGLIIGTWEVKNSVRINGDSANLQVDNKNMFGNLG